MAWIVGEVLSYIQINRLSFIFSFQSGGQISTEGRVTHVKDSGDLRSTFIAGNAPNNFTLFDLLEKDIADVLITPGLLEIVFGNGDRLRFESVARGQEVAFVDFPNGHQVID